VVSWVDVQVVVEITSLLATRLNEQAGSAGVRFDVTAKLEEKERKSGVVVVVFGLVVRTKPNVVKYEVEGTATIAGKDALIDQVLKVDPKSNIPFVFHRVYQRVFTAVYMIASLINTVYPPSDLLFAGKQGPAKSSGSTQAGQGGQPSANVAQVEVKPAVM
jgi:hypothetical protein